MNEKIGIIGAGNIGCAIAKGLVACGKMEPSNLYLSRKRYKLLSEHQEKGYHVADNLTLAEACDIILLSVLPGQAKEVVTELQPLLNKKNKLLISVVSAVSIKELEEWIGDGVSVVRIMPNTAVEYGASMTCIAGDREEAVSRAEQLFSPVSYTHLRAHET